MSERADRFVYWLGIAALGLVLGLGFAIASTVVTGSGEIGTPTPTVDTPTVIPNETSCAPPTIQYGSQAGQIGASGAPEMLGPCGEEVTVG